MAKSTIAKKTASNQYSTSTLPITITPSTSLLAPYVPPPTSRIMGKRDPVKAMVEEAVFKYLSPVAVGTEEEGSEGSPKGVDELEVFPFGGEREGEPA